MSGVRHHAVSRSDSVGRSMAKLTDCFSPNVSRATIPSLRRDPDWYLDLLSVPGSQAPR
jgi:hypothetical protein